MQTFPLPTIWFDQKTAETCLTALKEAHAHVSAEGRTTLPREAAWFTLANGIFLAASLGATSRADLVRAALAHFTQVAAWTLPPPQPMKNERPTDPRAPERYRRRADDLRAIREELRTPAHKDALEAMCTDYERLACMADQIVASQKALGMR